MNKELIKTEDGSHSLYVKELNEHYHSTHGAIQESKHVFIEAGLKHFCAAFSGNQINILEIGLGTGLNALLTFFETKKISQTIDYTALEAFPISSELAKQLNYVELLSEKNSHAKADLQNTFDQLHDSEWGKKNAISDQFNFKKIKETLQQIVFENEQFDLIYFDAFGPPVQPEMWTEPIFQKIYNATKSNGILVTYCAKGEVKRTLKKVGFTVESIPGPPEKREMIRAKKELRC
ncbi:MAG: SAM-dependent methyltransferase [Bacteroidetes bacterium]|nr:SAM-dependent methyltransferase [Bacteroidota bacterium]